MVDRKNRNAMTGGPGPDRMLGLRGNDRIDGTRGNDCIDGGPGGDDLLGAKGNDRLFGVGGSDNLNGAQGSDSAVGRQRQRHDQRGLRPGQRASGGPGRDYINIAAAGRPARANCGSGRDKVRFNNNERNADPPQLRDEVPHEAIADARRPNAGSVNRSAARSRGADAAGVNRSATRSATGGL